MHCILWVNSLDDQSFCKKILVKSPLLSPHPTGVTWNFKFLILNSFILSNDMQTIISADICQGEPFIYFIPFQT